MELSTPSVTSEMRQSEVGMVPNEWEVLPLGSLGKFSKGSGVRKDEVLTVGKACVRYGELYTLHHNLIRATKTRISVSVAAQSRRLRYGDILFAGSGETKEEIGKSAAVLIEEEVYAGGDIVILTLHKGDPTYFGYMLNAPMIASQKASYGQGDAVVHISTASLSKVFVPVPPIEEQRAIATALSEVDGLLAGLDALIAKKKALKQGAMQQLLTGKQRLPGFKGEWVVRRLGDVAEVISGATPRTNVPAYWNGNIPWCTPTDITGTDGKYISVTERSITKEGLDGCNTKLLPKGALLLCTRATIGEIKIAAALICTNQGFKSLVCGPLANNEFLYYKLLTMKDAMVEKAIGSTFLELSRKDTVSLELTMPIVKEQTAIAEVLSDMDAELGALEARRAKTALLKQGMMQELLTGRVRLI